MKDIHHVCRFKKMMIRGDLYFGFFLLQFPSVVTGGSSQEKGVGKVSISNNETESALLSVGTCCKKLTIGLLVLGGTGALTSGEVKTQHEMI